MKYAHLRLFAERDVTCSTCGGTGKVRAKRIALLPGQSLPDPMPLVPCGVCDGEGKRVERTELLHPGEPFFLLRGQDANAVPMLYTYTGLLAHAGRAPLHTPLGDGLLRWFTTWQSENPGLVKTPD